MVEKNVEKLIDQLVKIEPEERFVTSVLSFAKEWNAVDFISNIIEEYNIDDKQILYEILTAEYD